MVTPYDFIHRLKKVRTTLHNVINSIIGKYCSIALIWLVTLEDFIYSLKRYNYLVQHNKQPHGKVLLSSCHLEARSRVQAPLKSWIFFRLLYAIVKIAITTARIILHLISYPQFTYDLFHMHHSFTYLSREHMNPQLTCSQRQWLHSSVGRASHRYSRGHGFKPRWSPEFFSGFFTQL